MPGNLESIVSDLHPVAGPVPERTSLEGFDGDLEFGPLVDEIAAESSAARLRAQAWQTAG